MRHLLRGTLVLIALNLASRAAAVDQDDLYFNFYGGTRLDAQAQFGLGLGYAPLNSLGLGAVADVTREVVQMGIEPRWFIEPFELASAIGFSRNYAPGNDGRYRFLFSLTGAYLWALTPSLAARAELRGQYLLDGTSSALVSIGGRLVF